MSISPDLIITESLETLESRRGNAWRQYCRLNAEHKLLDLKRPSRKRAEVENDMHNWMRQVDILDRMIEQKELQMGKPPTRDLFEAPSENVLR